MTSSDDILAWLDEQIAALAEMALLCHHDQRRWAVLTRRRWLIAVTGQ